MECIAFDGGVKGRIAPAIKLCVPSGGKMTRCLVEKERRNFDKGEDVRNRFCHLEIINNKTINNYVGNPKAVITVN